jgi:hypothetical protein
MSSYILLHRVRMDVENVSNGGSVNSNGRAAGWAGKKISPQRTQRKREAEFEKFKVYSRKGRATQGPTFRNQRWALNV